jgi:hypothetical protein
MGYATVPVWTFKERNGTSQFTKIMYRTSSLESLLAEKYGPSIRTMRENGGL